MVKLLNIVRWLPLILLILDGLRFLSPIISVHGGNFRPLPSFLISSFVLFLIYVGLNLWYFKVKYPKS
jgi:hypothetical protein